MSASSVDVSIKSKSELKAMRKAKHEAERAMKAQNKLKDTSSQASQLEKPDSTAEGATKSKAELRAERRAKQEADRAAKAKKKGDQVAVSKQKAQISSNIQADVAKLQKKAMKKLEKQQVPQRSEGQKKVALFSHLHQYERSSSITKDIGFGSSGVHPAFIQLGMRYANGSITGSNARCFAFMSAVASFINDYSTPPQKELSRHLESKLKPAISFINQCRPLSVSMGSAIKYIKLKITHIPSDMPDFEAKESLINDLKTFVQENLELAQKAISDYACKKINDDDVIMIYGNSSLISSVLTHAHKEGRDFRVVVVDGRPKLSGLRALRRLSAAGIKCSYVLISALSYVLPEVTKVFLGAHGLLSNGYVMASVGTALVAMAAKMRGVPVIVCCEAYKFCERVQTDAFVNNEIGDPRDLLVTHNANKKSDSPLLRDDSWKDLNSLKMLHLTYDVTPPDYIAMVVTELGMIPCTSVPVVLRVRNTET